MLPFIILLRSARGGNGVSERCSLTETGPSCPAERCPAAALPKDSSTAPVYETRTFRTTRIGLRLAHMVLKPGGFGTGRLATALLRSREGALVPGRRSFSYLFSARGALGPVHLNHRLRKLRCPSKSSLADRTADARAGGLSEDPNRRFRTICWYRWPTPRPRRSTGWRERGAGTEWRLSRCGADPRPCASPTGYTSA